MNRTKRSVEAMGCQNTSVGERSALGGSTSASRCKFFLTKISFFLLYLMGIFNFLGLRPTIMQFFIHCYLSFLDFLLG